MKLLTFTLLLATIYYASAGKTARLIAAMNAMNAMGLGGNPAAAALLAGGVVPPIVIPGAGGIVGQPQFPQFAPGVPAFRMPAGPFPNMYPAMGMGPAPAANQYPFMGVPQMGPVVPGQQMPQQQVMGGIPMGNMQQQQQQQQPFPVQPDPLQRFRRQVTVPDATAASTVDTQIPSPTDAPRPCNKNKSL